MHTVFINICQTRGKADLHITLLSAFLIQSKAEDPRPWLYRTGTLDEDGAGLDSEKGWDEDGP